MAEKTLPKLNLPEHDATPTPSAEGAHIENEVWDIPPPSYNEVGGNVVSRDSLDYGNVSVEHPGMDTKARVEEDGRVNIHINEKNKRISSFLAPALRTQLSILDRVYDPKQQYRPSRKDRPERPEIPEELKTNLRLNVVIQVIGSRGDIQPFIALAKVLQGEPYGHRVRIATHGTFKGFVEENGVEFFSIGGSPEELMAFMVKNPGLMPGVEALRSGEVRRRRHSMAEMLRGEWRSCIEAGDGMGGTGPPFIADVIIANPPSFGHIHCAERLGIRLHLMFTMPWSPTTAFPHPLANIASTNMEAGMTNYLSYILVEMLTWQGLGDIVNKFRTGVLGLEPISTMWAPTTVARLKIPHTYCWSPSLIPKPEDWGEHISIAGFYFLPHSSTYQPPADLQRFLDAGPPPVYIGFGSIVVDDPSVLSKAVFSAIRQTGVRAVVSKGWGGLGSNGAEIPENVFMLGNVPHDWLFKKVSAVVHHGGAGTTAIGLTLGKPTVIVPFFGDQSFWASMVHKRGVGPAPIPFKELTAERLASAIQEALRPEMKARAEQLGNSIRHETGTANGAKDFSEKIDQDSMRCDLEPSRLAVWSWKKGKLKLSAMAVQLLLSTDLIEQKDLRRHRHISWQADEGPIEPISGGAGALLGSIGSVAMAAGDFPVQLFKGVALTAEKGKEAIERRSGEFKRNSRRNSTESRSPEGLRSSEETTAGLATSSTALTTSSVESKDRSSPDASSTTSPSPSTDPRPVSPKASLSDALLGVKSVGDMVAAGMRSPMDFSLAIARGFHNAPLLYGDETVRRPEHITGFKSGLKAAGKGLGLGFYDGISGLVTQPVQAVKKEGPSGFLKGLGKGIGGLILKPGAGIWGVTGYALAGIDKEVGKLRGNSIDALIMKLQLERGIKDFEQSTPEQRNRIVENFLLFSERKRDNHRTLLGRDSMALQHSARTLSSSSIPRTPMPYSSGARTPITSPGPALPARTRSYSDPSMHSVPRVDPTLADTSSGAILNAPSYHPPSDPDLARAIALSVQETSRGNAEENEAIARAIKASLEELKKEGSVDRAVESAAENAGGDGWDGWDRDEVERAIRESMRGGETVGPSYGQ